MNRFPRNSNVIICGDINYNLYNPHNLTSINDFIGSILSNDFYLIITRPAKFNINNTITPYTLIDQIWTNFRIGCNHQSGIMKYEISDHLPIFYLFRMKFMNIVRTVKYRQVNNVNMANFIQSISNINFNQVYNIDDK